MRSSERDKRRLQGISGVDVVFENTQLSCGPQWFHLSFAGKLIRKQLVLCDEFVSKTGSTFVPFERD